MHQEPFTVYDYQKSVSRTAQSTLTPEETLKNVTISLFGEVGELANIMKKKLYHKHTVTDEQILDELGDILFYIVWLSSELKITTSLFENETGDIWSRRFSKIDLPHNFFYEISKEVSEILRQTATIEIASCSIYELYKNISRLIKALVNLLQVQGVQGSLAEAASQNKAKLEKRYPSGYSHVASEQRTQ